METKTETLAGFLLARIAEDEDWARYMRAPETIGPVAQRILAECEAKRRIVELHSQDEHDCVEMHHGVYPADWPVEAAWGKAGEPWAHPSLEHQVGPCPTLLALAQPYSDHEGFRQEWRVA